MTTTTSAVRTGCVRCSAERAGRRLGSRAVCERCFSEADSIEREPFEATFVLRGTWALTRRLAHVAVPLALAFEAPLMVLEWVSSAPLDFAVYSFYGLVTLVLEGALLGLASSSIRGDATDVRGALTRSLRAYGRLLLTGFIAELRVLGHALLLVVPGVLRALSYAVAGPIALHEGAMGHDACRASELRMKGHRGAAFVAFLAVWALPAAIELADLGRDRWLSGLASSGALTPAWAPAVALGLHVAGVLAMIPTTMLPAVLYAKTR